jgi:high-affinity Fe2+/Pb2+ permease
MAKYTKKFMDTLIELIFGLVLLPVAASLIASTLANPDVENDSNFAILQVIIGIILIFVALGLVYHVIKQLF